MALKQVQSFQTSDGKLHTSRLQALLEEQKIEIRGVIQSDMRGSAKFATSLTTTDATQIIIDNIDKLVAITRRYDRSIKHERTKSHQPLTAKEMSIAIKI